MSHEGDATIIATLSQTFVVVKHLNRCIFPLLRHATLAQHSDDDIVESFEGVQLSFVCQSIHELSQELIGPYPFSQSTDLILYLEPRQDIVQWSGKGILLKVVNNARVKGP